jgi:hypothetical protein
MEGVKEVGLFHWVKCSHLYNQKQELLKEGPIGTADGARNPTKQIIGISQFQEMASRISWHRNSPFIAMKSLHCNEEKGPV